ncbi:diguanylate cyclase [Rhodocyclus tenuis]|nr:diguanylate cyclase [Rhodocyclus gracilis]
MNLAAMRTDMARPRIACRHLDRQQTAALATEFHGLKHNGISHRRASDLHGFSMIVSPRRHAHNWATPLVRPMNSELEKFEKIKASGDLPSPRGVALTIMRLTSRDDVGFIDIERAIKSDPAFVGRLLKTANIAARERGRPVVSVPDAIKVLGITVVRNLALGFSLVSGYRVGACPNFDYGAFWSRAIVTALAMQAILRQTRQASPDEAFCCGLLADIGRLAFATVHATEYSRLLESLDLPPTAGDDAERMILAREAERFALNHDELTVAMLADWGFPQTLIEPIRFRHRPESASFAADSRSEHLLAALRLADGIAGLCLAAPSDRAPAMARLTGRSIALRIDLDMLEGIVDAIVRDWHDWAPMLSLDSPPVLPSFGAMLAEKDVVSAPPAAEASATQAPLRVLVAAADATLRASLERLLIESGEQVFVVGDGEAALERALDVQPQVLIADWQLPVIDGLRLTRILRNTRLGRGMYVLIVTAPVEEERFVEVFDAGADDYLVHPINERAFLARLRAGARVVGLHEEVRRDHEELQHFAAELAVSNRRLHEASVTDALTGFHNRRYAMERLESDWAASTRSARPLSCMMIDLDDFKGINDRFGHAIGDKALVAIAGVLRNALRSNDTICRVGGDEFLVISPDSDATAIAACARRLMVAVAALKIDSGRGIVPCSVSIGVATRGETMSDTAALVKAADDDMYRAKPGGRRPANLPYA